MLIRMEVFHAQDARNRVCDEKFDEYLYNMYRQLLNGLAAIQVDPFLFISIPQTIGFIRT